jgi:hypothetical protein
MNRITHHVPWIFEVLLQLVAFARCLAGFFLLKNQSFAYFCQGTDKHAARIAVMNNCLQVILVPSLASQNQNVYKHASMQYDPAGYAE